MNNSDIKQCTKCGQFQPLSEYHKHKKTKDGLAYACKTCCNLQRHNNYVKNIERERAHDRAYRQTDAAKAAKRIRDKRYYEKNRDKILARSKSKYAAKIGKIAKEKCECCGAIDKLCLHHEDYDSPLNVMVLCEICHLKIHNNYIET